MKKQEKIVIIGAGEFAEMAYDYFNDDSSYEVSAFSVKKDFLNREELSGLPGYLFYNGNEMGKTGFGYAILDHHVSD